MSRSTGQAIVTTDWVHALQTAAWFPTGTDFERLAEGRNLFELVARAAASLGKATPGKSVQEPRCGAQLTAGFPKSPRTVLSQGLEQRLVWWPNGIPAGRRVAIVSSRLRSGPEHWDRWIAGFLGACNSVDPQQETLVTASRTATTNYVIRAAGRLSASLVQVSEPSPTRSFPRWCRSLSKLRSTDRFFPAYVSPPISTKHRRDPFDDIPLRDRCLFDFADRLLVCHVRPHGHLERLVRLIGPCDRIQLVANSELVAEDLLQDWEAAGASWFCAAPVKPPASPVVQVAGPQPTRQPDSGPYEHMVSAASIIADGEFLTHCTRRPRGPWPDQTEEEYLDQLIERVERPDRTAFDSLARIVAQRRILATSLAIRGKTAVVCLTEASPGQLQEMRVFRPHRCRWDFEPYGICIRRRLLERAGAKPVVYGDNDVWNALPADRRPFFQKRLSGGRQNRPCIDWCVEREWRHIGDIDLSSLPASDVVVFVSTATEAATMSAISPWEVVVVEPCVG